jgi:hypothetical protein
MLVLISLYIPLWEYQKKKQQQNKKNKKTRGPVTQVHKYTVDVWQTLYLIVDTSMWMMNKGEQQQQQQQQRTTNTKKNLSSRVVLQYSDKTVQKELQASMFQYVVPTQ